ncbi:ATP phosphoribosyltransferase [bacterium]|nr:ATP phosphoribosyltransferase [bacterium]
MKPLITVALPKGRLGNEVCEKFKIAGYSMDETISDTRKLIFEDENLGVRFFWAKPSDVHVYVERGAADVGIIGKDILLEYEPDVYELLDLEIGKCKICVAAKEDFFDNKAKTLRVATKYKTIAKEYYMSKGRKIDIITLNGSIEIAPLLNLSDVIVDIVETGKTLKENNLVIVDKIIDVSARFIVNKSSYRFKEKEINKLKQALESRG